MPAISIVLLITLLSAFLCTYLMKESKVREFKNNTKNRLDDLSEVLKTNHSSEISERQKWASEFEAEQVLDFYIGPWDKKEEYYDYAIAVYDIFGDKTTISDNRFMIKNDDHSAEIFHLSDYLSKNEILSISEELKRCIYSDGSTIYLPYLWLDEKGSPVSIEFRKRAINQGDSWKSGNSNSPANQNMTYENSVSVLVLDDQKTASVQVMANCFLPKTTFDEDQWEKRWAAWMNNDVLQRELNKAKENVKDSNYSEYESDSLLVYDRELFVQEIKNERLNNVRYGNVVFIATYRPWLSAMKELKTIYLLEVLLCVFSIYIVSKNTLKTYDKQKELNNTKNTFIAAMAHDLKTPLTVIRGYSENLLDDGNDKEYLHKIISKTDEIDDMVSKMLEISKLDSDGFEMERQEVVLNNVLSSAVAKYRPLMQQRSLSCEVDEKGQFELIGDERHLDQMLGNLIDNAVSYAEKDSTIKIEIDQNRLSISNRSDPIPEEKLKHIFDFSSGSKDHYGFGLYFAKKVADIHDLQLAVENYAEGVHVSITKSNILKNNKKEKNNNNLE